MREISDAIPETVKQKYGLTEDLVSDKQFMHAVDRIIEGNAKTRLDREMLRDMPELRNWIADYHKVNRDILKISKRAGTQADQLKDPFNNKYRSYVGMQPAFTRLSVNGCSTEQGSVSNSSWLAAATNGFAPSARWSRSATLHWQ